MTNKLYAVAIVACLGTSTATADQLPDSAIVPEHQWVEVVNPIESVPWTEVLAPLWGGRHSSRVGDSCSIEFGYRVQLVGREKDTLLLKTGTKPSYPANCNKGTLFMMDAHEYATMTERYEKNAARKNAKDAMVHRMMEQSQH